MRHGQLLLLLWSAATSPLYAADPITDHLPDAANSGCMKCHAGIEWIREPDTGMMKRILALGKERGDPAGCIVCHGGDPQATTAEAAHAGAEFYPDPSSPWINEHTCGQCHPRHVKTQWTSLMMTEAGKIQGTCWAFGSLAGGHAHEEGQFDGDD